MIALWIGLAMAHDLRPGVLALRETEPNRFAWSLTPPLESGSPGAPLGVRFPPQCDASRGEVRCKDGLQGVVALQGAGTSASSVVLHLSRVDGSTHAARFDTVGRLFVDHSGIRAARSGRFPWVSEGLRHASTGWDHLFFVFGLVLVAGRSWRLVGAVTAFTVGHSLTLLLWSWAQWSVPGAAAELVVALSVLLLAREAAVTRSGWTARYPMLVAGGFGLVHGLAFAGVLSTLELSGLRPLLGFNLGIELAQLSVLCAVIGLGQLGVRIVPALATLRPLLPYAIGIPAALWTIERALAW